MNHQMVIVLIDTGSTHSFMDKNIAKRSRLLVGKSHLAVQVANRVTLPCQGYCKEVELHLKHYVSLPKLYLLILAGCDIVLGVD